MKAGKSPRLPRGCQAAARGEETARTATPSRPAKGSPAVSRRRRRPLLRLWRGRSQSSSRANAASRRGERRGASSRARTASLRRSSRAHRPQSRRHRRCRRRRRRGCRRRGAARGQGCSPARPPRRSARLAGARAPREGLRERVRPAAVRAERRLAKADREREATPLKGSNRAGASPSPKPSQTETPPYPAAQRRRLFGAWTSEDTAAAARSRRRGAEAPNARRKMDRPAAAASCPCGPHERCATTDEDGRAPPRATASHWR
mmetsp:Transcript_7064/g.22697  ORF Transcript_7064/g.22697 Transcript_7064/m.22697 type:complete len:262 (+) Transcript_7064:1053-1838(+)